MCVLSFYLFSCGYIVRIYDLIYFKLKGNNDVVIICIFVMLKKNF